MIYVVILKTDNSVVAVFDRESAAQEFVSYTYKGAPYDILEFKLNEYLGGISYWRILCTVDDNQWACQRRFGPYRYEINQVTVKVPHPLMLQVYVKSENYNIALAEGKHLIQDFLTASKLVKSL